MLELVRTFLGSPASNVHLLPLSTETILAYPSVDSIIILNARTLLYIRTLMFYEVFPGLRQSRLSITCITIDPGMKLLFATMGAHIAVWSLSGDQKDVWRVHSSLQLRESDDVKALDSKSGLLAVSSLSELSVYTLALEDDLPTWTKKWSITTGPCSKILFCQSLTHLATSPMGDNTIRLYLTSAGRQIQSIRHPRPMQDFFWRFSRKSSRDDIILHTITSDAVLRIFMPVLDLPQRLQLHASLEPFTSRLTYSEDSLTERDRRSSVFWLEKDTMEDTFSAVLAKKPHQGDESRYRRLQQMKAESWDYYMRVFADGSLTVRVVANIDRRPPTLLNQFNLLQSPPGVVATLPNNLHVLRAKDASVLTIVMSAPLRTYNLNPPLFFDGQDGGLNFIALGPVAHKRSLSNILRFTRSPEGRGLAVVREDAVETWHIRAGVHTMRYINCWPAADRVIVLDFGKRVVLYDMRAAKLTLQSSNASTSLSVPPLVSLFSLLPTRTHTPIIGIAEDKTVVHIHASPADSPEPSITLHCRTNLPLERPPRMIIPVDPMAWSYTNVFERDREHDVLLSISEEGELAFWKLDENTAARWSCTGRVRTGKTGFRLASCSSNKKSVLVITGKQGDELSIWDSKESEFASGHEFEQIFQGDIVRDLDWTSTPDQQSVLAVGFTQRIVLLCQQRMTYFNQESGWTACSQIDISLMTSDPIADSIWLTGGTLLLGTGSQMLQYGQLRKLSPSEDVKDVRPGLFEAVARMNGPLPQYHPQMILQCLLWGKVELVKEIIVRLEEALAAVDAREGEIDLEWNELPVDMFLMKEQTPTKQRSKPSRSQYKALFNGPGTTSYEEDPNKFSSALVQRVLERLELVRISHLSPIEHAHLAVLVQTALEIDEQRRSLDTNGLRYLISMRSFYIINARASSEIHMKAGARSPELSQSVKRERLRFRDIIWAYHSESQEILLNASAAACGGKMVWSDAKALGIFLWLNNLDSMRTQMEAIARNQYMSGEYRDPTACSLFYFALGKVKLVHGLWKQAIWHHEQNTMLKFLVSDFSDPRWKSAARKNAFVLLGKQRFEYAAAFFLLGGSLTDAVNVCVNQLDDFQLAVALARVVEQGDDGPILKQLLNNTVLPIAFASGNRWLAGWAFWLLHRRDLAVRVLVSPLEDISALLDIKILQLGEPNYDDPSLALLFSQLKSKTLQTAKGTSEISGRTEFNFVLQTARVFTRMGCHALALDLVMSWSFERPTNPLVLTSANTYIEADVVPPLPNSPTMKRRPLSGIPTFGRRRSIIVDMDVPSDPSTRSTSPDYTKTINGQVADTGSELKTLLKTAKQNVTVPEFNMDAFF